MQNDRNPEDSTLEKVGWRKLGNMESVKKSGVKAPGAASVTIKCSRCRLEQSAWCLAWLVPHPRPFDALDLGKMFRRQAHPKTPAETMKIRSVSVTSSGLPRHLMNSVKLIGGWTRHTTGTTPPEWPRFSRRMPFW